MGQGVMVLPFTRKMSAIDNAGGGKRTSKLRNLFREVNLPRDQQSRKYVKTPCSKQGRNEKRMKKFGRKTRREETTLEDNKKGGWEMDATGSGSCPEPARRILLPQLPHYWSVNL
jgi:hypothetical protein